MWQAFFRTHETMEHMLVSVFIDDRTRRVATEQAFTGILKGGKIETRHSVSIFDLAMNGQFSRTIVWLDGDTPPRIHEELANAEEFG